MGGSRCRNFRKKLASRCASSDHWRSLGYRPSFPCGSQSQRDGAARKLSFACPQDHPEQLQEQVLNINFGANDRPQLSTAIANHFDTRAVS
jgi:hypothetical protein